MVFHFGNLLVVRGGCDNVTLFPKLVVGERLCCGCHPPPHPRLFQNTVLVLFESAMIGSKFFKNLNFIWLSCCLAQFHYIPVWCSQSLADPPHKVNFRLSENKIWMLVSSELELWGNLFTAFLNKELVVDLKVHVLLLSYCLIYVDSTTISKYFQVLFLK